MPAEATTDEKKETLVDEIPAEVAADEQPNADQEPAVQEPKPDSEAPKEQPSESPGQRYDARVKEIAESLGWSKEDIDSYPSPAHLARALNAYHKQLIGRVPQPAEPPAAPVDKNSDTPSEPAPKPTPMGWKPKLNPDEYPELIEELTSLHNDVYGRASETSTVLSKELTQMRQALQALAGRIMESDRRELDQQFARLPNDLAKLYGRGPTKRMKPDSETAKARGELMKMMGTIAQAQAQAGLDLLPIPDLFDAAVSFRHANELFNQQIKDVAATLEPADDDISMRPTNSKPKDSKGLHDDAIEFVEEFERTHGGR